MRALAVLLALSPLAADADPDRAILELDLPALLQIEISTGTPKPLNTAPAVATVITARDIELLGARHLDEVLEMVPGLHVGRSALVWLNPVYGIRGIATGFNSQTLLMLNGVRFQWAHSGGPLPTFRLPVSAIERIEVIRGPGSAVYGADAYAGVINVITKTGRQLDGAHVAVRGGSFDTQDGLAQWGGLVGGWEVALSVESQRSDGDNGRRVGADLQSLFDGLFQTRASLAPGALQTNYDIVDSHVAVESERWHLHYWNWQQNGGGLGQGVAQALDLVGRVEFDHHLFDLRYNVPGLRVGWEAQLRYSYQHTNGLSFFHIFPRGAVLPIGSDGNIPLFTAPVGLVRFPDGFLGYPRTIDDDQAAEAVVEYTGFGDHRLRMAVGGRRDELRNEEHKNFGPGVIDGTQPVVDGTLSNVTGTPYIFYPGAVRDVGFVSLQDEWALAPDWELTAGVRYDHYSDFGSTTNPRLALVWSTTPQLTSKLLYGRAFRAPSFCELYCANNPATIGNPAVEPETIDTVELAFDYIPRTGLNLGLNLFHYQAKALIDLVHTPGTIVKSAQNARREDGQGLETEVDWRPAVNSRLRFNYAYYHAGTPQSVQYGPPQHAYLNLERRFADRWLASTQVNYVGERKRAAGDNRPPLDGYVWTDLSLRLPDVAGHWQGALSVRNVFDVDAREPSDGYIPDDLPLEGRSVWLEAGLRWR